jgi:hypothetical protein
MGGATGSRECAPDDELRDNNQLQFAKMMGFANSAPHPAGWGIIGSSSLCDEAQ